MSEAYTASNTDRQKEYIFYKEMGICVRCHKIPAEPNKVLCLECSDLDKDMHKRYRDKNIDKIKDKDNTKYHQLKEKGICTYCKHEKSLPGKTKCNRCYAKIRNRRNAKKTGIDRSERVAYGICYICGKDKCMKDKGVCKECYKTRLDSIKKIMYLPVDESGKMITN